MSHDPFERPTPKDARPYHLREFSPDECAKHERLRNAMERMHRERRNAT